MARVLELREVSVAVKSVDAAAEKFRKLGFDTGSVFDEPAPPIEARFASIVIGTSSIGLMEGVGDNSPISRFLSKRGEGLFSFTLLVDDLEALTREWKAAGVEFVLNETMIVKDGHSMGRKIPVMLANWTKPRTLNGLVIELVEFQDGHGRPYYPPSEPSGSARQTGG